MNKLKEIRKQKGVSIEELSEDIGVDSYQIQRFEDTNNAELEVIQKIADYFQVSIPFLLGLSKKGLSKVPLNISWDIWDLAVAQQEIFQAVQLLEDSLNFYKDVIDQGNREVGFGKVRNIQTKDTLSKCIKELKVLLDFPNYENIQLYEKNSFNEVEFLDN